MAEGDYVLGTNDAEVTRLGVQHHAWREVMFAAWRRAGLRTGAHVIDVGAGPGWATWDLADAVGTSGSVLAVERAERFTAGLQAEKARRQLGQVKIVEGDLMHLPPPGASDMTWCRWVASFTESVPQLVRWIHGALRPGGVAVFHEYASYGT